MNAGTPAGRREFLTVAEVAEIARVIPRTVRMWIKSGKLTGYRAGAEYRVHAAELHEFLRVGRVSVDPAIERLADVAPTLNTDQRRRLAAILSAVAVENVTDCES
ncbi:helix-turn-helix domain-containing protein [Rhodococcus ruber]